MIIQPIFSDFIAVDKLNVDNEAIVDYCLQAHGKKSASENDKPIFLQMNEQELFPLYSIVNEKFNEIHKKLSLSDSLYQELVMSWINVNHVPSPQEPHAHDDFPGLVFTGVYYPLAEKGCSHINFINTNPALKYVIFHKFIDKYNEYNSAEWSIEPETGDLIIFPAWLQHYVSAPRSNTNNKRISIAFNSRILSRTI